MYKDCVLCELETDFVYLIYMNVNIHRGGRDSSVGIATRYGLDGPGIESWWGGGVEIFRTRADRSLG
jgi:hypothetical protein